MTTELMTTDPAASVGDAPGPTPLEAEALEVVDGYLVAADGEIVGLADQPFGPGLAQTPERFEVRDADGCDWVLEKISDAEAEAFKVEAQLRALRGNLETKARWYRQVAAFLRFRFGKQVEAQARRDMLPGKKTAVYPHGRVAIKVGKESMEITDNDAAGRFLKDWLDVGQLKLAIRVGDVLAAIKAYQDANDEAPDVSAFAKVHAPAERVTITTGIGKDAD